MLALICTLKHASASVKPDSQASHNEIAAGVVISVIKPDGCTDALRAIVHFANWSIRC